MNSLGVIVAPAGTIGDGLIELQAESGSLPVLIGGTVANFGSTMTNHTQPRVALVQENAFRGKRVRNALYASVDTLRIGSIRG